MLLTALEVNPFTGMFLKTHLLSAGDVLLADTALHPITALSPKSQLLESLRRLGSAWIHVHRA